MNGLLQRRLQHKKSIIVIPHTQCSGTCKFCFLEKLCGAPNWDVLCKTLIDTLINPSEYSSIFIMGGELFEDRFLTGNYIAELEDIITAACTLRDKDCIVSIPVSLENIGEKSIPLIKHLKTTYPIRFTTSFSQHRFESVIREEKFFKNLNLLPGIFNSVSVPIFAGESVDSRLQSSGLPYFTEEPIILNADLGTSYASYTLPADYIDNSIHCLAHCTTIITSNGVKTCAGVTRRPAWIPEVTWDKLCNDTTYLQEGYEEVTSWYNCATCEKQFTCPGMCWLSYYAQKNLYNNRKCLYK